MPAAIWRALAGVVFWAALGSRGQAAPASPSPPLLRIDFMDVGQGDAALITSPTGKTVLIDGGPRESATAVTALLRERGVGSIDLVVLTHRHADHLGGIAAVVRTFGARMYMDAAFPHPSPAYAALLDALAAAKVPVRNAERGRKIDLGGGATMTLLGPPEPPITRSRSNVNANSVVLRVDYRQVGVLFAADAEANTERWLLGSGAELRASVLKVAHHGSRYSSTRAFLRAVGPKIAVISVGAGNDYGHPAEETLAALARLPARVYRTDLYGTVTVTTDGTRVEVRPARGNQEILASP